MGKQQGMARNRLNNKYYLYFSYCILVYLVLNIQSVYSQDNYLKCVTINEGKLEEDLLCLNATFYSDCDVVSEFLNQFSSLKKQKIIEIKTKKRILKSHQCIISF